MRRHVARLTAAGAGVLAAQAAALAVVYRTPPPALGPASGVVPPPAGSQPRGPLAAAAAALPRVGAEAGAAAGAVRGALEGLHPRLWWPKRQPAPLAVTAPPDAGGRRLRLLVLGDSLVTGVGGDVGGPPRLPAALATELADRLGATVSWAALGLTGAGVDKMRAALVPRLTADVQEQCVGRTTGRTRLAPPPSRPSLTRPGPALPSPRSGPPSVVFLMCGVNDLKFAPLGATASAFRAKLAQLLADVRRAVGPDALICVPGLPVGAAQRFSPPLSLVVTALADAWDRQKAALCEPQPRVGPAGRAPGEAPGDARAWPAPQRHAGGQGGGDGAAACWPDWSGDQDGLACCAGCGGCDAEAPGGAQPARAGAAAAGAAPAGARRAGAAALAPARAPPPRDEALCFVGAPVVSPEEARLLVCFDGVHPNDLGYARWAAHLAASVAHRLLRGDELAHAAADAAAGAAAAAGAR